MPFSIVYLFSIPSMDNNLFLRINLNQEASRKFHFIYDASSTISINEVNEYILYSLTSLIESFFCFTYSNAQLIIKSRI